MLESLAKACTERQGGRIGFTSIGDELVVSGVAISRVGAFDILDPNFQPAKHIDNQKNRLNLTAVTSLPSPYCLEIVR